MNVRVSTTCLCGIAVRMVLPIVLLLVLKVVAVRVVLDDSSLVAGVAG